MSPNDERGDRERAKRVRPDDDRGSMPVALAIVFAAAVSFALVVTVLVLGGLVFVYFFSAYVLARLLRLVRLPLRRLLPGPRGRARAPRRRNEPSSALALTLTRVWRPWRLWR